MSARPVRPVPGVLVLLLAAGLLLQPAGGAAQQPASPTPRALPTQSTAWKGDFDGMVARRFIRVRVPYSRSLYFNDKGRERGLTADLVRDFERYLNQKYAKQLGNRPITVSMAPTTRDELLQDVADGFADAAAGNLTVTAERKKLVDFVAPADQLSVSELVVTGPKSPAIAVADDLAGQTVHVRKSSSYYESLLALNDRLQNAGRPAVTLVLVPDALEDEDMMEMLNAGVLGAIVVDDWKARMWAQVLPKLKVNTQAVLRDGGLHGVAIRKDSPQFVAELTDFWVRVYKRQNLPRLRMAQYYQRIKQIQDPTGSAEWKRFEAMLALFRKYGERYAFAPLMLAAQGYQESQLQQNKRSQVGAIGVMQVMPAIGAEMKVGNIKITEPNIHAGAKYLDQLMTQHLAGAQFSEANRALFAFAAYNAGPSRIAQMRTLAQLRGLDPNKWFNNVEMVTAEKVGLETTTYVRNIYKYYIAYKMMLEMQEAQTKARETVTRGG